MSSCVSTVGYSSSSSAYPTLSAIPATPTESQLPNDLLQLVFDYLPVTNKHSLLQIPEMTRFVRHLEKNTEFRLMLTSEIEAIQNQIKIFIDNPSKDRGKNISFANWLRECIRLLVSSSEVDHKKLLELINTYLIEFFVYRDQFLEECITTAPFELGVKIAESYLSKTPSKCDRPSQFAKFADAISKDTTDSESLVKGNQWYELAIITYFKTLSSSSGDMGTFGKLLTKLRWIDAAKICDVIVSRAPENEKIQYQVALLGRHNNQEIWMNPDAAQERIMPLLAHFEDCLLQPYPTTLGGQENMIYDLQIIAQLNVSLAAIDPKAAYPSLEKLFAYADLANLVVGTVPELTGPLSKDLLEITSIFLKHGMFAMAKPTLTFIEPLNHDDSDLNPYKSLCEIKTNLDKCLDYFQKIRQPFNYTCLGLDIFDALRSAKRSKEAMVLLQQLLDRAIDLPDRVQCTPGVVHQLGTLNSPEAVLQKWIQVAPLEAWEKANQYFRSVPTKDINDSSVELLLHFSDELKAQSQQPKAEQIFLLACKVMHQLKGNEKEQREQQPKAEQIFLLACKGMHQLKENDFCKDSRFTSRLGVSLECLKELVWSYPSSRVIIAGYMASVNPQMALEIYRIKTPGGRDAYLSEELWALFFIAEAFKKQGNTESAAKIWTEVGELKNQRPDEFLKMLEDNDFPDNHCELRQGVVTALEELFRTVGEPFQTFHVLYGYQTLVQKAYFEECATLAQMIQRFKMTKASRERELLTQIPDGKKILDADQLTLRVIQKKCARNLDNPIPFTEYDKLLGLAKEIMDPVAKSNAVAFILESYFSSSSDRSSNDTIQFEQNAQTILERLIQSKPPAVVASSSSSTESKQPEEAALETWLPIVDYPPLIGVLARFNCKEEVIAEALQKFQAYLKTIETRRLNSAPILRRLLDSTSKMAENTSLQTHAVTIFKMISEKIKEFENDPAQCLVQSLFENLHAKLLLIDPAQVVPFVKEELQRDPASLSRITLITQVVSQATKNWILTFRSPEDD